MPPRPSPLPLHPVLLAAIPALFLFSHNAVQQVSVEPLWVPLAASIAAAAVVYAIGVAILRDWHRGAVAASLVIAAFFSFGDVALLLGADAAGRWWLAGAYGAAVVIGLVIIVRGGGWLAGFTRFANLAALVLVAFNAYGVIAFGIGVTKVGATEAVRPLAVPASAEHRPDIYYIVLDRYANAETLDGVYGYDNHPFLGALEERGFAVAEEAWANYLKTAYSLVSSLNADYLDADALGRGADPSSFAPIHLAMRGRLAVPATLKGLGYEYVHIGNYWLPGITNVDADTSLRYGAGSEFTAALLATTAWSLTEPVVAADADPETIQLPSLARAHTLFEFAALEQAATRPGPTYVFAHILLPHPPYVFNADGSEPTTDEVESRSDEEAYVEQLKWANGRLIELVDTLLDVPAGEEPVVILQADEGPFPERFARNQVEFNWLEATPDEIAQKFGILMAVHLPETQAAEYGFDDQTSPVNLFRIVLNAEFGADLPLLPNRTYLIPDYQHLYTLVPYERP